MLGKVLILLVAILTTACVDPIQDPEFWPYITEFEDEYDVTIDFTVVFHEFTDAEETTAICKKSPSGKKILVDTGEWEEKLQNPLVRRAVLFHEMGHCAFWLKHDADLEIDSAGQRRAASYMYPENFEQVDSFFREEEVDYYTEELRDKIANSGKRSHLASRGSAL